MQNTDSFRNQQNGRTFIIFYQVNCKSDFVIHHLECKTKFNLGLNSHRKDVYKVDAISPSRHFAMNNHIFNREAVSL